MRHLHRSGVNGSVVEREDRQSGAGVSRQRVAVVAAPLGALRRAAPDSEGGSALGHALPGGGDVVGAIDRIDLLLPRGRQLGIQGLTEIPVEFRGEGRGLP